MSSLANVPDVDASGRTRVRLALLLAILTTLGCGLLAVWLQKLGFGDVSQRQSETVTIFLLYLVQDRPMVLPTVAALVLAALLSERAAPALPRLRLAVVLPVLTVVALVAATAVRFFVFSNYDLSLDEYLPRFQARIFEHGLLFAPLSETGLRLHAALQPFFTYVDAEHGLWGSHYRPVHAALLALAGLFGAADLLNPFMAAVSIPAVAAIARRVWPDQPEAALVAPVLLILTPQFLITSGSGFAFPSHLAFNLVWLALFLQRRLALHWAAAFVGVFAIGLHQVNFHPLFAAPFLLALLAGRFGSRWHVVPYVICYSIALPVWVMWPELAVYLQTGDASVLPRSLLQVDYIRNYIQSRAAHVPLEAHVVSLLRWVALGRFWLWLSPAVLPLVALGVVYWNRLALVLKLAAASFVLEVLVNQVLMPNQMLSWGARYSHPVLGNLVLFATGGLMVFVRNHGWRPVRGALTVLALASAVFVGVRGLQVTAKVAPRAAVQQAISRLDADVVVIDAPDLWFATDFVRNDPFLETRPLVVWPVPLHGPGALAALGSRQVVLGRAQMTAMGLPEGTPYEPGLAASEAR